MTKAVHRVILLLALLALSVTAACASAPSASPGFYPVAVWYSGGKARAPMLSPLNPSSAARWGHDLDQIKALGFNTVKCWVDWSTAEPERGVFDFKNLNLLMKLAGERHLRVIVQIYTDSAPQWVGALYPDARFVDRSGAVIDSQSAPGYCIDDSAVREEIVNFIAALSRDANGFPALYGWDVWSEPHVVNWADFPYLKNAGFCYCRYSQERFREWLRAKYKTLVALNAAWYRDYRSWQQVTPPRFSTILSYTDYLDWRAFIDDKLAGDLRTRVEAVRSADHTHPITSHAAAPALFTSPTDGYGEPDDWKMNAVADFFGTSLYPKHAEATRPWPYWMLSAGLDFTRSAGYAHHKAFWIGELQAGQGVTSMRIAAPVTSSDLRDWMWEVVAHGAREIAIYAWYPMSSGYESGGYGLIHLDGALTARSRAAGEIARVIEAHAAGINHDHPATARVGIVYDRLSYMVGGGEPSLSKLGNAERDSLMGVYRAFFERQIPVDFVDLAVTGTRPLSQYKILFLPFPVMISGRSAQAVRQYVEQGGTVVAEARLAWNNARGYASSVIPGEGLDRVFGAREKVIRPENEPGLLIQPGAGLPGLAAGEAVPVTAFEEDLQPYADARVLARFPDGEPAMVENTFGRGKAILIGSFAGLAFQRIHNAKTAALLRSLAREVGVMPQVSVSGSGTSELEVRRLTGSGQQWVFVFNHSSHAADATITLRLPWQPKTVEDVVENAKVPAEIEKGQVVLKKSLAPESVWVLRITD